MSSASDSNCLPGSEAGDVPHPAIGTASVRVTLDVSPVPARPAGAGRYVIELCRALRRRPDVELVPITRAADRARWETEEIGASGRDRRDGVVAVAPRHRPQRLAWEQLRLPSVLDNLGPAVHHSPHYTMPERSRVPVVVTVHDLTFFDHPEWHQRSKVHLFRRAVRVASRRAGAVVCVSAVTAARLQELCDVRAPVVVATHGVDLDQFGPAEPESGSDAAEIRALGIDPDRPLVVFVGTIEPRKGVVELVGAFDRIASRHRQAQLVLAGQPGWGADIDRRLARTEHRGRISVTGYVPPGAVPALFRRAAVVAYPALQEGYGLPALEALACGAPLVTTSGTPMAELAGGAAVLVPPGDVDALSEALDAEISGTAATASADRRRRGLEIAASQTWDRSAADHVRAYWLAIESSLEA